MKWHLVLLYMGIGPAVGIVSGYSQETDQEMVIKEYTIMEHFAPELVIPADERRRLKIERREEVLERREVINQLDIPDRRKRKLLRELYSGPFTDHYNRELGALEAEDGQTGNQD